MPTPINFILPSLNFTITSQIIAQIDNYSPTDYLSPYINVYTDISASILNNLFCYVDNKNSTMLTDISTLLFGVVPPSKTICPNDDLSFNNVITPLITGLVHSADNSGNVIDASYGSIYIPQNTTDGFAEDFLRYTYVYSLSNSFNGVATYGGVTINPITNAPVGIYNAVSFKNTLDTSADNGLAKVLELFNRNGFKSYTQDNSGNITGNSTTAYPTSQILRAIYKYDPNRFNMGETPIQVADVSGNVTIQLGRGSYVGNIGINNALFPNYILAGDTLNFIMKVESNAGQLYKDSTTSTTIIPPRFYKLILNAK